MNLLDNYLLTIQEAEKPEIKNTKGPVFLYHGTRESDREIKRRGLTIKDNGSAEKRTGGKKAIWLTSSLKYAKQYTKEGHILSKKVGMILKCKVDKKHLKFVERPLKLFDEYIYFKDIPSKDIEIVWKAKR